MTDSISSRILDALRSHQSDTLPAQVTIDVPAQRARIFTRSTPADATKAAVNAYAISGPHRLEWTLRSDLA